jgi:hypothetical protein
MCAVVRPARCCRTARAGWIAADRALEQVNSDLNTYTIEDEELPVLVETPGGEEFSCWQYYYD